MNAPLFDNHHDPLLDQPFEELSLDTFKEPADSFFADDPFVGAKAVARPAGQAERFGQDERVQGDRGERIGNGRDGKGRGGGRVTREKSVMEVKGQAGEERQGRRREWDVEKPKHAALLEHIAQCLADTLWLLSQLLADAYRRDGKCEALGRNASDRPNEDLC